MINPRKEQVSPHSEDLSVRQPQPGEPQRNDEEPASQPQSREKYLKTSLKSVCQRLSSIYRSNSFLINIVIAIFLAYLYPPLGAIYLAPQITASWIAVIIIFLLSGLSLKTNDFRRVLKRFHFILFVQAFNFLVVSSIIYGVSRFMITIAGLQEELGDGLVICASLPMTVNMVLVLTAAAGGDEAAAVFNAALGNLLGVLVSPMLILLYVGVKGTIDLAKLFTKLLLIIFLPILVGQMIVKLIKPAGAFAAKHKKAFKLIQEYALVYTVYTVFCKTFLKGSPSTPINIIIVIAFELFMISVVMVLAWYCLRLLYKSHPELRIMGLFGCTHKSIAVGIPLISTIYETSPYLGLYTLPLLIWHPAQLLLGSALVPSLSRFLERERNSINGNLAETEAV